MLVTDLQNDAVLRILKGGLEDVESIDVCLWPLLGFLPALILPSADPGPMPTVAKPFPTSGSFTFPSLSGSSKPSSSEAAMEDEEGMAMDEEREDVRKAALGFMINLSGAVRKVDG